MSGAPKDTECFGLAHGVPPLVDAEFAIKVDGIAFHGRWGQAQPVSDSGSST